MKKWLSISMAAGLLLYPFAAFAADYGSQPTQTQQAPPVAQTLVREGDFAVKLAAELKLGNPSDETVAEDMLAKAGIAPQNGWISDYPMTPVIIGQLQDAIVTASAQGTLPMSSGEATTGLNSLAAQMSLPTPASQTPPQGTQPPADQQNPNDIDHYYYDAGPPIVTYYPPPYYYSYLYDWVPYPTFWFGFWYPGFYICHNFTTVVVFDGHHHGDFHRGVVSNHVIDPVTRRVAFVDPVVRTGSGVVRPMTTLRTENGDRFRNLADMRRGISMTGFKNGTRGSVTTAAPNRGFNSPDARRSAQAIYSRSMANMRMSSIHQGSGNAGRGERRNIAPSAPGRQFITPSRNSERRSSAPERSYTPGRTYAPERMMRSSTTRPFTMTPSITTPSMRQGGEPVRNFARSNVPSYNFGRHSVTTNSARPSMRGGSSRYSGVGSGSYRIR